MKTYTVTYADRYYPQQCNGKFTVEAASQDEARKAAVKWLQDNGGIEGISFSVR